MPDNPIETILRVFNDRGQSRYGDERVTHLQHALQCAGLARRSGAESPQIAAALLHDIGHIIDDHEVPDSDLQFHDDMHEERAYRWLKDHFGPAVADPIRLHVTALRYLCTVEPSYLNTLSQAARRSCSDQGGVMSQAEIDDFRDERYAFEAVQLRRWDDLAKDPGLVTPPLEHFIPMLEQLALHAV